MVHGHVFAPLISGGFHETADSTGRRGSAFVDLVVLLMSWRLDMRM
jgi:hypothetical protein